MIIKHIDYSLLPTCLRVSKHFFKHAGKYLYSHLVIDYENDGLNVLRVEPELGRKHFKSQLLKHVKSIVIRPHTCPTQKAPRAALTKAARYMTNLERVILMPASDFFATSPLCHEERGCPIVAGLKSKSLTIGGKSCGLLPFLVADLQVSRWTVPMMGPWSYSPISSTKPSMPP